MPRCFQLDAFVIGSSFLQLRFAAQGWSKYCVSHLNKCSVLLLLGEKKYIYIYRKTEWDRVILGFSGKHMGQFLLLMMTNGFGLLGPREMKSAPLGVDQPN